MSLTILSKESKIILVFLTLFVKFQYVFGQDLANGYTEDLILKLYEKYKEAVLEETETNPMRRFYDESKQYKIHVEKLKEVNGYKRHNLFIKQSLRNGEREMIYIINPIESRFPHPYLSLEEFKDALLKRSEKIRQTEATTKTFGRTTKYLRKKTILLTHKTTKTENNTTTKNAKETKSIVTETTNNDIKTTSFIPTRTNTKVVAATTEKQDVETQIKVTTNNDKITKEVDISSQTVVTSTPVQVEILNTTESTLRIKEKVTAEVVKETTHIIDTTKRLSTENALVQEKESNTEFKNAFVTTNSTLLVTPVSTTEKPTEKDVENATLSIVTTVANGTEIIKDVESTIQTIFTTETASINVEKAETSIIAKVKPTTITDAKTVSDSPEVETSLSDSEYYDDETTTTSTMATTRRTKLTRRTLGRPMVFMEG